MFEQTIVEILAVAIWSCFTAYVTWYFTVARSFAPITTEEARILWKIHRKDHSCNSNEWREIKRGSSIVGFVCTCGYRFVQQRPLVGGSPPIETKPAMPILVHIRPDVLTVTKRTVAANPSD